jgi:hypothetical protein
LWTVVRLLDRSKPTAKGLCNSHGAKEYAAIRLALIAMILLMVADEVVGELSAVPFRHYDDWLLREAPLLPAESPLDR